MKILIITIGLLFTFSPITVFAEEEINEQETIAILLEQVKLLIKEVERLQSMLRPHTLDDSEYKPLPDEEIRNTISSGVAWFKEAQEESGHFKYEYLPYEDEYLPLDNIVRQAGGLYVLGEVALVDESDKYELKNTLKKGIRYFDTLSNRGEWNGYSFRCVSNSSTNDLCQLGATSLALVGLIDAITRYPELRDTYEGLAHDYGEYILSMKKEGSGFRHAYNSGSIPSENESSFSNGEAILALTRYYMYSPNEETKKVIDETFLYFKSDDVPFDFPLYLWVMAALKDMQELWPNEKYITYAKDYTDWRLSGFAYRKSSTHNMCAYVEGVASAYSVLEGNIENGELENIAREIHYWLQASKKLQITDSNKYRIIHEDEKSYFGEIKNMNQAKGGFLTDQNELTERIDFTQHCVNSYLQQLVDIGGKKL